MRGKLFWLVIKWVNSIVFYCDLCHHNHIELLVGDSAHSVVVDGHRVRDDLICDQAVWMSDEDRLGTVSVCNDQVAWLARKEVHYLV